MDDECSDWLPRFCSSKCHLTGLFSTTDKTLQAPPGAGWPIDGDPAPPACDKCIQNKWGTAILIGWYSTWSKKGDFCGVFKFLPPNYYWHEPFKFVALFNKEIPLACTWKLFLNLIMVSFMVTVIISLKRMHSFYGKLMSKGGMLS